tara:strand:- start:183 stop:1298 length:1116 start_codon:yes stop_codon:yes gene_type:complete
MPNFKPKSKKKIKVSSKNTLTLDNKHTEKINEFQKNKNNEIPKLKEEIKEIKKQINNEINIEKKLDLNDNLKSLKKQIKTLKKKEKDYFLNNSNYIFNYFEKKKELSEGNSKKKILHSFFDTNNHDTTENKKVNESETEKYLNNIENTILDINKFKIKYDRCPCGGELIKVENMGVMICNNCSKISPFLVENEKPSYKEPPKEVCFYAYKRINHFREILAQFQAKETTQIPPQVITDIKSQIKKERITIQQLTNKKAKDILKKLGYNKYYEHIPFIKDKLGIKPPIMSTELEDTLCNLFLEIQKPYSKNCPDDRVNFLNYYYVLYKMCELLGEDKFLPFFPMLKDPVKRIEQDEIWKKICAELEWEFIPTV